MKFLRLVDEWPSFIDYIIAGIILATLSLLAAVCWLGGYL
jgi:hypothetical protein